MDKDALVTKLRGLKAKARAARRQGNRQMALRFRAGARRLQRRIKGLEPKTTQRKKKES
jgi:hypothetical protein